MFRYVPHPHIRRRVDASPTRVADQLPTENRVDRFNSAVALGITKAVGSMWCAYAFTVLALIGLPGAIQTGVLGIVQWVAQTFLQLVLLSVILLGQNIQAQASDKRAQLTFEDAEAVLAEAMQIQAHLKEQDEALTRIVAALAGSQLR